MAVERRSELRITSMKILVLNCGSSSLKYEFFEMEINDGSGLQAGGPDRHAPFFVPLRRRITKDNLRRNTSPELS